ncbi:BamA/TamA family outer membrane protein [Alkalinema sp. FACHB-956]|uniref:BamA/TamA family outer membrane protein n=1 Tax=Alkalinema sp. FACHB-956 TaxID=2692768 RepID=UPI001687608B|nr:BamA/TamA family outer membrane protein [Alkalinema sp. FACHB-956]MBD2329850.1 BamA/TamA family outer membrane protein [Alkalinema sp. FACHB-956]
MRFSTVAVCALTALSALDITQQPAQAATPTSASQSQANDVVVNTEEVPVALPATRAIAQPEKLSMPERATLGQINAVAGSTNPRSASPRSAIVQSAENSDPQIVAAKTQSTKTQSTKTQPVAALPSSIAPSKTQPTRKTTAQNPKPSQPKPSQPNPSSASKTPSPATKPTLAPDLAVMVTEVTISGVDEELQRIARQAISTQPGGQTSGNQLQADIATLLETGLFANAKVNSQVNNNGVAVNFVVEPTIVRSLQLINTKVLPPEIANRIFQDQFGKPVQPAKLNQGVRDLNQWYRQNGYGVATILGLESTREGVLRITAAEGQISDIRIRFVDEFGRTVDDQGKTIQGRTQESFIRREIKLAKGMPFQESAAKADLDRLVKTGLFLGGRVTLEGDPQNTIVVYNLAEQQARRANLGGGYSSDAGLYGSVSYSDFNFNGVGQQIGGSVLVGSKDVQFNGRFSNPYRDSNPNAWGYSINGFRERGLSRVFDDDIKLANGDRVREGRFGGGVAFNRPLDKNQDWQGSIGLNYTRVSLRDQNGNLVKQDSQGNPLSWSGTGLDDLYTVGFTASRDKRNNPTNPTQGSVLSLSTEQSIPIGVGNVLSNRLTANYSQYIPIGIFNRSQDPTKQEVLAFNVQAGTTIGDLPPYNAFTLGGVNSVRGYGQGEVGTGRSYVQASAEYRFPIYKIVGGTLFADYASDLGSSNAVIGEPGVQRGRPGNGFGVGAGLRVNSPLGILRADWAFTDRGDNRIQFGLGQKF